MGFGYLSALLIAAIVLLALHRYLTDRALWRRVHRALPQAGAAGVLKVMAQRASGSCPGRRSASPTRARWARR